MNEENRQGSRYRPFPRTRWSVVADAQVAGDPGESKVALEELCQSYWLPIYAFIRRSGFNHQEAEDLTQDYLVRLLERDLLADVRPEKGRLRSYLLALLKPFLLDHRKYARALKRGGGKIVSMDIAKAEQFYAEEPGANLSPDQLFDQGWALAVLARALDQLRDRYEANGKTKVYQALKGYLQWNSGEPSYAKVAEALNMSEGSVKVSVHRMRKRSRSFLRAEVENTLAEGEDLDVELRYLLSVLDNR